MRKDALRPPWRHASNDEAGAFCPSSKTVSRSLALDEIVNRKEAHAGDAGSRANPTKSTDAQARHFFERAKQQCGVFVGVFLASTSDADSQGTKLGTQASSDCTHQRRRCTGAERIHIPLDVMQLTSIMRCSPEPPRPLLPPCLPAPTPFPHSWTPGRTLGIQTQQLRCHLRSSESPPTLREHTRHRTRRYRLTPAHRRAIGASSTAAAQGRAESAPEASL